MDSNADSWTEISRSTSGGAKSQGKYIIILYKDYLLYT